MKGRVVNKEFKPVGVASRVYNNSVEASQDTYSDDKNVLVSTPIINDFNPYNDDIKKAKVILDVGCGVGRNLPFIIEHTKALYIGLDPNIHMLKYFGEHIDIKESWEDYKNKHKDRILIIDSFDKLYSILEERNLNIDVVISTFVFQHIGYMYKDKNAFNITDIGNSIRKCTKPNTIWFLLEHDGEDDWINKWLNDMNFSPTVYIRGFNKLKELTCRDHLVPNKEGHHLIIIKE